MRVDGSSTPKRSHIVTPSLLCTPRNRRDFLRSTGTAAASAITLQAMPWIQAVGELKRDDDFEKRLDLKLQDLINIANEDDVTPYNEKLEELFKIGNEDNERFIRWYVAHVDDKNQDEHFQRKQIVLETIGRKIIVEGSIYPQEMDPLQKEKYTGEFFPIYTRLIKNNDTSQDFVSKALMVCDNVIFPRIRDIKNVEYTTGEIGPAGISVSEGVLSLYETALNGVSKLPVIDSELKRAIFEIPYDCEVFGDKQEKSDLEEGRVKEDLIIKAHDRVIATLSHNFFGLKQNQPDIDGLNRLIQRVGLSAGCTNSGWPPYILYGVIDRNPEYFESVVKKCIEGVKRSLSPDVNKDLDQFDEITKQGLNYLLFFSNLTHVQQSFYFPQRLPHHYPKVHEEVKERVDKWAMEQVVRPIFAIFLRRLENDTPAAEAKNKWKNADNIGWHNLINHLSNLLEGSPALCESFVGAIRNRLTKDKANPYLVEMDYRILRIPMTTELTSSIPSHSLALITETLPGEKPLGVIRGIGITLAASMYHGLQQTECRLSKDFLSAIEKYNEGNYSTLDGLDIEKLNELERFILKLIYLIHGDADVSRAIIPDLTFPKFKEDGSHRLACTPFLELKQNAFLVLAASASAIEIINPHGLSPKESYTRFQKAVIGFLEKEFGYYANHQTIGKEIGALLRLYGSVYPKLDQSKSFVYSKTNTLGELFQERILTRIDEASEEYKTKQAELAMTFARDEFEVKDFHELLTVNMKLSLKSE